MDKITMEIPFFQTPNDIFECEDLDVNEKIIYIYLCRCANNGSSAFPSYSTIGNKCSVSERTAIRAIKKLIEKRLVKKTVRKKKKNRTYDSNLYSVNVPEIKVQEKKVMTQSRKGYDTESQGIMTQSHKGYDTESQYKEQDINNYIINKQQQQHTKDEYIKNNENSIEENENQVENENNYSPEDITAIKDKADVKLGTKTNKNTILNLVKDYGYDKVKYYLDNWERFGTVSKHNTVGFFINAVRGGWEFPKNVIGKPVQATNYEQRDYDDAHYESFYDNFKEN